MIHFERQDLQEVSIYVATGILNILVFATAFSGHSNSRIYVNCVSNSSLSKEFYFKFGYPYSKAISYNFPNCGVANIIFSPITQKIDQYASSKFFEMVVCYAFSILYAASSISFIFVIAYIQSVGDIKNFTAHLDFCKSIPLIMTCKYTSDHHHTTL
ncbi:hypothetical protein MXB_4082, partial [Myxobolus squamalis]